MNFKQIVDKVNLHAGLQGRVASVTSTNFHEYLAEATRSAWVNFQNMRKDWKFLRSNFEMTTTADMTEYSNSYIEDFVSIDKIARWSKTEVFLDGTRLKEFPLYDYQDQMDTFGTLVGDDRIVFLEDSPRGIIIGDPTGNQTLKAWYYRQPQILTSNTDIPWLPEEFHYYIVWLALEDVAAFFGNSAVYERHSWKADILRNKIMQTQVPAKKVRKKPFYRGGRK